MSKELERSKVGGALTPELTGMTPHQQFANRGAEGRTEGRRGAIRVTFTVLPRKSPCVNQDYVCWLM